MAQDRSALEVSGGFWAKEVDFFPRKIVVSMSGSGEKKPPGYSIVIKRFLPWYPCSVCNAVRRREHAAVNFKSCAQFAEQYIYALSGISAAAVVTEW